MSNIKMKVLSTILVAVLIATSCYMSVFASTTYLTNDDYGSFSGSVSGISGTVNGEYRGRYGSNILDRMVMSIIGHIGSTTTNKAVAVGAYESSSGKTRYIAIDTLKSSDGSRINALSQNNSSTGWKSKDNNNAEWYATKSSISGAISSYVTYTCVYSSTLSYVGQPNLFNVN